MMSFVVPITQARRHLGELLDQAFRRGRPFLLTKNQKPMAVLLGVREFAQIMKLVEKHDPGLAETLAILADPELLEAIEQGEKDAKAGRTVPIDGLARRLTYSFYYRDHLYSRTFCQQAPLAVAYCRPSRMAPSEVC